MKLNVTVSYNPEHFNRRILTLVPAMWTAETFDVPGANRVYGLDQLSANEAIKDLVSQLQAKNLSGTLKINRTHTTIDQKFMDEVGERTLANDPVYQSYWY